MNDDSKIPASVLIIAQNVESSLKRCLDSLERFDEVVLIDGGSDDKTQEIAKSYPNVSYYLNPWPGFIKQRNYSLDQARHDWCFMIDADEAATPELVDYLADLLKNNPDKKMYRIMRTEFFEGHAIEQGHGRSDYQERFFLKKHIRYVGGVHHGHLMDGRPLSAGNPEMGDIPTNLRILHDPDYGLEAMVRKLPRFSLLIAHEKLSQGKSTHACLLFVEFFGTFLKTWLKSWRGGRPSFVLCMMKAIQNLLVKLYIYNEREVRNGEMAKNFEEKNLE